MKYNIIYADPAWKYNDKPNKKGRTVESHYPTMDIEDIKALPISELADDNCVLFIWVTFPKLQEGLDTIKAWGFTYKTIAFNWVKRNKVADTWFWGMGKWTRANSEICLLATKGTPKRMSASVHSVLDNPISIHSRKPNEARKRIIELCGDLPRVELFAREQLEGFDVWGNQVENSLTLGGEEKKLKQIAYNGSRLCLVPTLKD